MPQAISTRTRGLRHRIAGALVNEPIVVSRSASETKQLVDDFHRLYYDSAERGSTWKATTYFGHTIWKMPSDMWLYSEILYSLKPALFIETGTAFGGSALYFAHLMDRLGAGKVVSVDLNPVSPQLPRHERIEYFGGKSSTAPEVVAEVRKRAEQVSGPIVVCLDSDHSQAHVLGELKAYADLVTPGSYLIVEDSDINGHPVYPNFGPGPHEAMDEWLPEHPEFVIDEELGGRHLFSMHTFLKRQ